MENNFDKTIKKMLEGYEVEYKASDWDSMEEKIEANSALTPELEDVLLDGVVYDKLHNLEKPYDPEHWSLMREKLDATYAFRRKLMKYKVAEIALVALFIVTLVQFLPFGKTKYKPTIKVEQNNLKASNQNEQAVASLESKNNQMTAPQATLAESVVNSDDNAQNITLVETTKRKANSASTSQIEKTIVLTTPSTDKVEVIPNTENVAQQEAIAQTEETSVNTTPTSVTLEEQLKIALLSPIVLKEENNLIVPSVEEISGSKVFSDLKQPIKVRIGMTLGADANYVMTPNVQLDKYTVGNFNRFFPGYSGGFTLGFQYSNWEIETGALYSAVNYSPKNIVTLKGGITEYDGFVEKKQEGTHLDLIRIPVNLKYSVFSKKKWNVYVHSGVTINMVAKAFYDFTTTDAENSDGASRNLLASGINIEEEQKYDHDGFFESGQLSKNTFLTANLGFGIERYFTPRMSIFVQPNYQHQFSKGLGPQKDRINSISIQTGAKVALKKRKKSKR